ncbi:MAG TPA: hypothetical protein VLQ93_13200 [Myxococcaceae bacterium]|nr:hypothetical protein [Myxococcaceae bacterium]
MVLSNCLRGPAAPPPPLEEDESIIFPDFSERRAVMTDEQGQPYDLDGVTLRALTIAANDFIPPGSKERACWDRQEAHRYRVIREGNILFVRVYADPAACEREFLMLDHGVKYAISTDGRILRRLFTGEPEGPAGRASPDAGAHSASEGRDLTPFIGATWGEPSPFIPPGWLDGGSAPDGGSPPDGGSLPGSRQEGNRAPAE